MNIITYWTFDLFHIWHLNLLKRCKDLCEWWQLIVWVSSDKFNQVKWKQTIIPYKDRKAIIEALKCVDKVICEDNWFQKAKDIKEHNAQMVMWDDWQGSFDDLWCVYISRTPWISTTGIKQKILESNNTNGAEIKTKWEAETRT